MLQMKEDELRTTYPLHWIVWENDIQRLKELLDGKERGEELDIDKMDIRGRTPLMLAVTLDRMECARELLKNGANADSQNKDMWSVSHEAISTGDYTLLKEVIKYRDYLRTMKASSDMRSNLEKLKEAPDFYAEMSWEFSSWVPFVSKMCPSDTYKIYKKGSSVRIDTTLVGFEGRSWQRGQQTFLFRLHEEEGKEAVPQIIVIDHQTETASIQSLTADETLVDFEPPDEAVYYRMTSPVSTTFIDIDRIGFERSKGSGLLSWIGSGERKERVAGFDCKVFNASNVDLVTKTRTEHLTEENKARFKQDDSNPLSAILNMVRTENDHVEGAASSSPINAGLSPLQYLDADFQMEHDIGKPRQVTRKSNTFKATLWLAEEYPLSLLEQVAPIVNLMSSSSAHFARLNQFMRLQLPAGFPVKIEIPLFHVVSAKITFGRVNEPGPGVLPVQEATSIASCPSVDGVPLLNATGPSAVEIESTVFDIPSNYRTLDDRQPGSTLWWPEGEGMSPTDGSAVGIGGGGGGGMQRYAHPSAQQQEEMLLQLAIAESLREGRGVGGEGGGGMGGEEPGDDKAISTGNGSVRTGIVTPRNASVLSFDDEDRMLALAIERSLQDVQGTSSSFAEPPPALSVRAPTPVDTEGNALPVRGPSLQDRESQMLELAMKLSAEEAEREKQRREREEQEDEDLRRVLELSMSEK